ncbi:MAG: carboxylesterase/lipase family protein [Firmicutes bacterium]|nr:carboxylesterase/lipase family protein [Bacillota bacterium]
MEDMDFIVNTEYGAVKGKMDNESVCFLGVPYGKAPTGNLRFKRAVPCDKWEDVLDCTYKRAVSPQHDLKKGETMTEDCLYMNIWSPKADNKKRPVLFYMHGGSFVTGSPNEEGVNGAKLAKSLDIVIVSVSFRLGVLGFLDFTFLGDEFEANCGLTDAVEALKWVNRNIEFFGGDPDNVTISGQSSGASMAVALNCVEEAYPYFHKTYSLSAGPVLMVNQSQYVKTAQNYLRFMHIKNKEELFTLSAEHLVSKQREFARAAKLGAGAFTIDIDGKVMKAQPIPAAVEGITCNKPIYLSTTREEMSFLFIKPLAKALDVDDLTEVGVSQETEENKVLIGDLYKKIYKRRALPVQYSDMIFRMGNVWFAEAQSKNAPVWLGRFDYSSPFMTFIKLYAFHSVDLSFIFANYNKDLSRAVFAFSPFKITANKITAVMQKNLKDFMTTGKMDWEQASEKSFPAMCWSKKSKVEQCMPPELVKAYGRTAFRHRSFTGDAIKL